MDYASTAERGGWYMSAATMTAATVSRWTMGGMCLRPVHSYSLLCRWFRAAVAALDRVLETALFHRLDAKRVRRLRGAVHPRLQPGQILPGMCAEVHRRQKAECERRRRVQRGQLEGKNPL